MRKRLFEIIEKSENGDKISSLYDLFMMVCIIASILPMCFKNQNEFLISVDRFTVVIFIIDYVLRLFTADLKLERGIISFIRYPFTFLALVDLFSILPSILDINKGFKLLKVFRLGRTLRIFRSIKIFKTFKIFRYSSSAEIIVNVFKKQKESLVTVFAFAAGYVFIISLLGFTVEPETFNSFFDAVYWAIISLTSVGYGDIYAVSTLGKLITMCSSVVGIAIVALPSSIITAGYLEELNRIKNEEKAS